MSYLGLLQQTGLLVDIYRTSFVSKNSFGEQVTEQTLIHEEIPCRKQTMREEDLISAGVPTDMATIKWMLFLPTIFETVDIVVKPNDVMKFNRKPSDVTYYNVVHVEDATEEQHHFECIIEEIYQS